MSDQSKLGIGQIITSEQFKDAIHVAVAPVEAAFDLYPGQHISLNVEGKATPGELRESIGVVDPFLKHKVTTGERFWLFLYPGSITSLRHDWSHPAFQDATAPVVGNGGGSVMSESEKWMRNWARKHMGEDYYGENTYLTEDQAYENAIQAGHNKHVGPYENARDYIDNTWWNHWETITGCKGDRDDNYFSCSC